MGVTGLRPAPRAWESNPELTFTYNPYIYTPDAKRQQATKARPVPWHGQTPVNNVGWTECHLAAQVSQAKGTAMFSPESGRGHLQ